MLDLAENSLKSSQMMENSDANVITIKKVIDRKIREYQIIFYQHLKTQNDSHKQVRNQRFLLLIQFKNLSKVLKMLEKKNTDKPPFTMHSGFLRWKLKTDYYGTRGIMEKIVLNQNISTTVAMWRMKKFAHVLKYDRSVGKIKKIAQLLRKCHEVIQKNNQKEQRTFYSRLKYQSFNEKKNEYYAKNQLFIQTLKNKIQQKTRDSFNQVVQYGPKKMLCEYVVEKNKQFERNSFRSMRFLVRKEKLICWYRFMEVINRNMSQKMAVLSQVENPSLTVVKLLIEKQKQKQIFVLKMLERKSRLLKDGETVLQNLVSNSQKAIFKIQKINSFKALASNPNNFSQFKKKQQAQVLAHSLQTIYMRKLNEGFNKMGDKNQGIGEAREKTRVWKFLNTLDGTYKEKLKHLLSILQKESKGNRKLALVFLRQMKLSYQIKKWGVMNILLKNAFVGQNVVSDKDKIKKLFRNLMRSNYINKLLAYQKLKYFLDTNEIVKERIIQRMIGKQKLNKFWCYFLLKNNHLKSLRSKQDNSEAEKKNNALMKLFNKSSQLKDHLQKYFFNYLRNFSLHQRRAEEETKIQNKVGLGLLSALVKMKTNQYRLKSLETLKQTNNVPVQRMQKLDQFQFILQTPLKKAFASIKEHNLLKKLQKRQGIETMIKTQDTKLRQIFNDLMDFNRNEKQKLYIMSNLVKKIALNYHRKREVVFNRIRNPEEIRKQKQNACNKLAAILEKINRQNHQGPIRKLGLKSNLVFGRHQYIIKNIMMRKNQQTLEECFYLIRAYGKPNFQYYLRNPQILVQMAKMIKKRMRNDDIYSEILMEPCYYVLKQNAGLLKPHELEHLENLMYLLKRNKGHYVSNYNIFTYKTKGDDRFTKLRNEFIETLKDKMLLIQQLQNQNEDLLNQISEQENPGQKKKMQMLSHEVYAEESELVSLRNQYNKQLQSLNDFEFAIRQIDQNDVFESIDDIPAILKLKKEIQLLQDQFNEQQLLIKNQQNDIANYDEYQKELLIKLKNNLQEKSEFETQIKTNQDIIDHQGSKNIDLIKALDMIDKLIEEIKRLKAKLNEMDQNEDDIHNLIKEQEKDMQNLQRQISYQNQYSNYEEFIQDRENIKQRLDDAKNQSQTFEEQKSDLQKRIGLYDSENLNEEQQEEYELLNKKINGLSQDIQMTNQMIESMKRQHQEMATIKEFETEQELEQRQNKIQAQNQDYIRQLEELKILRAQMEMQLEKKESELQKLKDRFPNGREKIEQNNKVMELARNKILPLQLKLKEIKTKQNDLEKEREEKSLDLQRKKLNGMNNELDSLKETLQRKQALLEHLIAEIEKIKKNKLEGGNLEELVSKIDLLKKEIQELQKEIENKDRNKDKKKFAISDYENFILGKKRKIDQNDNKIVELKQIIAKALSEFKKFTDFETIKAFPKQDIETFNDGITESRRKIPKNSLVELQNFHDEIKELKLPVQVNSAQNQQMQHFVQKQLILKLKRIQNNNLGYAYQQIKLAANQGGKIDQTISVTSAGNDERKIRLPYLISNIYKQQMIKNLNTLQNNVEQMTITNVFKHFYNLKHKALMQKFEKQQAGQEDQKAKALFIIMKGLMYKFSKCWFALQFESRKQDILFNYSKMFKLMLINRKYSEQKQKYYLRKWHQKRNENPFVSNVITNIIRKTSITSQISLWRMKINDGPKPKRMNPLKWVAAILLKNTLQNHINDNQAIFLFNMQEKLPNLDIFNSNSTFSHGPFLLDSNYNTFISGKEKDPSDSNVHSNLNRFQKRKSLDPKYIVFQMLNGFIKKKNLKEIYNAYRKISELKPISIVPQKKQTKNQQQSQLIKFLIEQNMINKRVLEERMETIQKQQEEIKEKKVQLHFVKNHYHFIFVRRIQEIIFKQREDIVFEAFKDLRRNQSIQKRF